MKTIRKNQVRRNQSHFLIRRRRISLPLILMTFGYFLGCVIGVFVAINTDAEWTCSLSSDLVAQQASGLFTVFCGCAAYCLGMLFLATSYFGFICIPGVFSLKGFLSTSVFTACVRSGAPHGLERACTWLLLPGVFLLPAMMILGQRCMYWSVRLLRCRAGEFAAPDPDAPRALGATLVLLFLASAVKTYFVPYVLNLI